ncbi:MAG: tripartite tricarboxylate transporter substrate binding protein [Gracilibacteraceae bacterium]|jgi:tripartite-type tricarboxylate transporter receptor subunit TctC|nr:tripartite tricarboxylate transporter substrate binding protein [Gracilibacteraceae bacterium]
MRTKTKIGCLLAALSLALMILSACGTSPTAAPANGTGGPASTSPAEKYPAKPIVVLHPHGVGGITDTATRALQPFWEEELGTQMIVDNHTGAGGQISWTMLRDADPDGYTIASFVQPHVTFTMLLQNAPYSWDDFYIFGLLHEDVNAVDVLKTSPWNSMEDMIEDMKARPNQYSLGAVGRSDSELSAYIMMDELGIEFNLVLFDGGGPARTALLGGHIDGYLSGEFSMYGIKDSIKVIGLFGDEAQSLFPEGLPVNDQVKEKYGVEFPTLSSVRGYGVTKAFAEQYPDRLKILEDTFIKAVNNPAHIEALKAIGGDTILTPKIGDEADKEFKAISDLYAQYQDKFK